MKKIFQNKKVLGMIGGIFLFQIVFIVIITRITQLEVYDSVNWNWQMIPVIFGSLCIVADVLLFLSARQTLERKITEQKNQLMNQELEAQLEYYGCIIEHLENMSEFRHDVSNFMQTIQVLIDRGEYTEAEEIMNSLRERVGEVEL